MDRQAHERKAGLHILLEMITQLMRLLQADTARHHKMKVNKALKSSLAAA
jgi:hypothetical protein